MANVDYGPRRERILTAKITPEVGHLMQTFNCLTAEDSHGLCLAVGVNFVGSLLVDLNSVKYSRLVEKHGFVPTHDIVLPTIIARGVKVDGTEMTTGDMIFKHASGPWHVGLVLNGPLAGLITTKPDPKGAVSPIRFYNDEPMPDDPLNHHPYYPRFINKIEPPILLPGDPNPIGDFLKMIRKEYLDDYTQYVEKLRAKLGANKNIHVSQVLFALCDELGLRIDKKRFQTIKYPDEV